MSDIGRGDQRKRGVLVMNGKTFHPWAENPTKPDIIDIIIELAAEKGWNDAELAKQAELAVADIAALRAAKYPRNVNSHHINACLKALAYYSPENKC